MNYYLDVDGTILTKDHHEAIGLHDFLDFILKSGEVYWLTTHCRELDTSHVLETLQRYLQPQNFALAKQIKPTQWRTLKTEAIDFSEPFYWFDDYVMEAEKKVLKTHGCFASWAPIRLGDFGDSILETARAATTLEF